MSENRLEQGERDPNKFKDLALLLRNKNLNVNCTDEKDEDKLTPLMRACGDGMVNIVKLLICLNANINSTDIHGKTPLLYASQKCYTIIVSLMIENGAVVNCSDNAGCTPLHNAAKRGNSNSVKLLLEKSADINCSDNEDQTPLHHAAARSKLEVANLLIQFGADIDCSDNKDKTPLHYAAWCDKSDIAMLLLNKGADVNCSDNRGETPLHHAARWGNIDSVKLLLEQGADVNCSDNEGDTPLHHAARWGRREVAKLLIQHGAVVNCSNRLGLTPVFGSGNLRSEDLGNLIDLIQARYPQYAQRSDRFQTYSMWPVSISQRPEQLADAGFYYTGRGDRVVCFYCGGGLKDWGVEDDPWIEHAAWFSNCEFVKILQDEIFIMYAQNLRAARSVSQVQQFHQSNANNNVAEHPEHANQLIEPARLSLHQHVLERGGEEATSNLQVDNYDEQSRMCKVCLMKELGIVFLPCGHMATCTDCAPQLTACPICRVKANAYVRAYLP